MIYRSNLSSYITGVIDQKKALGYSFSYGERYLERFDSFCIDQFPQETTITQAMGISWATIRDGEKAITTAKRIAAVRELARYMQRKGIEAYVIPHEFAKQPSSRYVPHIFTDKELAEFFQTVDETDPKIHPECMEARVMPVLFRLIYTCGLRPQEGRLLKREHIDLKEGTIFIPESKKHRDRIVPLSEDMLKLCRIYSEAVFPMTPKNEYFFPCKALTCYKAGSIRSNFHKYIAKAGITEHFAGNKPRIYDFRHTFATKRLYQWMKEGKNLDAYLPYLSAYMGHEHLSQTAYYIHLVPEIFPTLTDIDWEMFSSIIPEVPDYEV